MCNTQRRTSIHAGQHVEPGEGPSVCPALPDGPAMSKESASSCSLLKSWSQAHGRHLRFLRADDALHAAVPRRTGPEPSGTTKYTACLSSILQPNVTQSMSVKCTSQRLPTLAVACSRPRKAG